MFSSILHRHVVCFSAVFTIKCLQQINFSQDIFKYLMITLNKTSECPNQVNDLKDYGKFWAVNSRIDSSHAPKMKRKKNPWNIQNNGRLRLIFFNHGEEGEWMFLILG